MMKRERKERKKIFGRLLKRARSVAAGLFVFFLGGFSRTINENRVFRGSLAEISGIV